MPTLLECWASKAATKQRRGRAGRVKPGFCWHLYSSHTHDRILQDYQLPEMLRVGLEDLVLQILVLDLGEPSSFLRAAVDPPTELAMKNALQLLESLGAAECNWEALARSEENATQLTALGYHLATLPVHPRVGKLLIYGNLFGVNDSCLTIAAAMTSRSPFVGGFENRDAADEAKREMASDDQLASLLAYNEWTRLKRRNNKQARAFLRENYLSYMALNNIAQLRKQLQKYMKNIGFVGDNEVLRDEPNLHLVKAMLAAGLSQNIIIGPKKIQRGQTAGEISFRAQKIKEVFLHPSTIAFAAHTLDSRYLCYHEIVKTSKVYVRDACSISKFSLLLFGGSLKVYQTHGVVSVDEWIRFKISPKPATLVKYLRNSMEALLLEKIMDPKLDITGTKLGRGVIEAVTLLLEMEC
ncbi:hypothetical protein THAOC_10471 [Thalassiosira oceanica]|uniref:Helicase-associated domain-containing protein n=1 Tax=Thalassiosira oceanica TaxID=159749 RepID=K0STM9_THAOC|nr:hypothetical protein THAOC_10471 [Thalassiosira oceanica]|eukprot:EJK68354.1 hypothetical protein THAOC_10471 [Thalassiosira oceanica]